MLPTPMSRRTLLRRLAAATFLGAPVVRAQPARTRLRMLLNTGYSGPQAWLLLAQANGHLAREGVELDLTPGGGAYTAAPRMIDGGFDLAYGDVNSLIEEAARRPAVAPVGVFMMFQASPSAVAVRADGPIRAPRDLEGCRLTGHSTDVALRTFGAFCLHNGVDRSRVEVGTSIGGMRGLIESVLAGEVQGAFGYVSTFSGALASARPLLLEKVRFLQYAEWVPSLHGSVLMASRRLRQEDPALVTRIVRALSRGLADMLRDPDAGIEAVARIAAGTDRAAEKLRLLTTLRIEMNHADSRRLGIGDADDARLGASIALMAKAVALPRVPALRELFVRDHLPPAAERVKNPGNWS
jgi:NitT/TauT family transport system substrate-binding protein